MPPPIQVIRDRETQETKGYGFVTFNSSAPQAAQQAMARLNGTSLPGAFEGRIIRVSPSNKWRGSDAGGGGGMVAGGPGMGGGVQMAGGMMGGVPVAAGPGGMQVQMMGQMMPAGMGLGVQR